MKYLLSFQFIVLLFTYQAHAQNDAVAIKALDSFSEKALAAPSVMMKFRLINEDLAENSSDTTEGSVLISRDRYMLDLPDNKIWFDGSDSYSYLPAEQEVTITKPGKKNNSFMTRPSSIFTMYRKDYKIRLIEEKKDIRVIDLYPEDIKSEIIRIRLNIGNTINDLKKIEYKRNDGVVITVLITEYNLKQRPGHDAFTFNKVKYSDAEVIDMR